MELTTSAYQLDKVNFEQTHLFETLILDYINQKAETKDFAGLYPNMENIVQQIKQTTFSLGKRKILAETLHKQYQNISLSPAVKENISLLEQENTYTITTGHQLSIFGGPMFFIYKIVSTIKSARLLQETYPQYNFVPVFWMASEDHDFNEIASFHLFGKKYTWETSQTGAVGQMYTSEIKAILEAMPEKVALFEQAYTSSCNLTEATRYFVNELFKDYGLVCLDGDDTSLKKVFIPVIKEEIFQQPTFSRVQTTSEKLAALNYKVQVNPREINFFYLDKGIRERIVEENGVFKVLNTNLQFTKEELFAQIENTPEKFSPNVMLRPVYQQMILPNLIYIGGAGELAYWLELKTTFEHFKQTDADITFPMLMPRNMALILNKPNYKKFEKLNLKTEDLFLDEVSLRKQWIEQNTEHQLSLTDEKTEVTQLFQKVLQKAMEIDKSMEGAVMAEEQKVIKSLENLEKRLQKAEERTQETQINQLLGLKEKLFPEGKLQERYDNFLNFYINDNLFIEKLMQVFNPFEFTVYILSET